MEVEGEVEILFISALGYDVADEGAGVEVSEIGLNEHQPLMSALQTELSSFANLPWFV